MILVDAGPLVALIDRNDRDHRSCVETATTLQGPLITTWPVFTEACYLLGHRAGWKAQDLLWRLTLRNDLRLHPLDDPLVRRSHGLMKKYRDVPMDLADATLVAVAEFVNERRVFTLDDDFQIYRIHGRKTFLTSPANLGARP